MSEPVSYGRAMVLVTASSLLVPVIGLVTAPVLTQSLGVVGRGEAGAAIAPNLLIVGVATLGLPQALTYHVAKRPHLSRIALGWAAMFSVLVGAVTLIGVILFTPFLSAGDENLAGLMILGTLLALPALIVSLLRGAAAGRQMWAAVAAERVVNSVVRLIAIVGLALLGLLDVTNAVLVMSIAPVIAGIAYWKLALPPPKLREVDLDAMKFRLAPALLGFGSRIWLGSVATMLIARLSSLLVTPLSDVAQLGLLIVAITISDLPYIVTQAVRDVAFGASSAESDIARLQSTSRVATMIAFAGSVVLGATLPLWISFIFGKGFDAAIEPTWLLLASSVLAVPGLVAGAGLDSAGRPGLRSFALVLSLVLYLVGLLLLVPPIGALGAAIAGLASVVVSTVVVVGAASKILRTPMRKFFVPERADITLMSETIRIVSRRIRRMR